MKVLHPDDVRAEDGSRLNTQILSHIFEKTGVANRAEAAAYTLKRGLAAPEEPEKG